MVPFDLSALQQAMNTHRFVGELAINSDTFDRPGEFIVELVRVDRQENVLKLSLARLFFNRVYEVHLGEVSGMELRLLEKAGENFGDVYLTARTATLIMEDHHLPEYRIRRWDGDPVKFALHYL